MCAWMRYKLMDLQTEGIHAVSGTHQDIKFDLRKDDGLVNVRHKDDLKKLLDTGRYVIALEHPDHGGITYDEQGWEVRNGVHAVNRTDGTVPATNFSTAGTGLTPLKPLFTDIPKPKRGRPRGR